MSLMLLKKMKKNLFQMRTALLVEIISLTVLCIPFVIIPAS